MCSNLRGSCDQAQTDLGSGGETHEGSTPPFAPRLFINSLRLILFLGYFRTVSLQLRQGCRLLRGCRIAELIDEANVPSSGLETQGNGAPD
jgi:hypothetical protein